MLLFIEKNSISSYLQCYELQKETKEGQESGLKSRRTQALQVKRPATGIVKL